MADRSYARDALGRFAKVAGQAMTKAAKKAAAEAAEDLKRVAKAKLVEQTAVAKSALDEARRAELAQKRTKADIETDSDATDWEIERAKARSKTRKALLAYEALRTAERATK